MEVGGGSLFNWLRFSEMCVNREQCRVQCREQCRVQCREQRREPEGRKQRAGESCVELLLQEEGGHRRGREGGRRWEGVAGCPDPNRAVGAGTPDGKVRL